MLENTRDERENIDISLESVKDNERYSYLIILRIVLYLLNYKKTLSLSKYLSSLFLLRFDFENRSITYTNELVIE